MCGDYASATQTNPFPLPQQKRQASKPRGMPTIGVDAAALRAELLDEKQKTMSEFKDVKCKRESEWCSVLIPHCVFGAQLL